MKIQVFDCFDLKMKIRNTFAPQFNAKCIRGVNSLTEN